MRATVVALCAAAVLAACARREDQQTRQPPAPAPAAPAESVETKPATATPRPDERQAERARLVEGLKAKGITDVRVLDALGRVQRHAFMPEAVQGVAYTDRPQAIGYGQTISQPYIVAFMSEAAQIKPTDRCLEIGTGSGYQAAVLAELCAHTASIEYLPKVAKMGEAQLRAQGYGPSRVALRIGDGFLGWPERAPFDVILVTAAPEKVPEPLLEQLAVGGRLVIPVGPQRGGQELERWTRRAAGKGPQAFENESLLAVRFVPFLGDGAAKP